MPPWLQHSASLWLIGALLLAISEVIAPGFFLIFIASGAAITGAILSFLPGQYLLVQVGLFAVATGLSVLIGYRWYRKVAPSEDPLLNDRIARLVGETVEVSEPIVAGTGRVRVGDGAWLARGPDAPLGARVRVVGGSSGELLVELA